MRWLRLPRRRRRGRQQLAAPGTAVTARHTANRQVSYAPERNGLANPGEVVWVRVAFEDNSFAGKDRPVLVVGRRDERTVYALQLSSQPHHDGQPHWLALGSGPWDQKRRPSWVRLDRVLELHEHALRRETTALPPAQFRQVSDRLQDAYGWR